MFPILRKKKSRPWRALLLSGFVLLFALQFLGPVTVLAEDADVAERALGLEDCVRIALERNPLKLAASEGFSAAREKAEGARAHYYPEVDARTGYSRWQRHAFLPSDLVQPGLSTQIGPTDDWVAYVSARLTLFDGGRRRAMLEEARARRGAAENEVDRAHQEIILGVHHAFFSHLAAMETMDVAKGSLARSREHLELVEKRRKAGAAVKAEVLRVRVEVEDAGLGLVRAEALVETTRAGLNSAMGLPVDSLIRVDREIREFQKPDDSDMEAAFSKAIQSRPEILAIQNQIDAAKSGIRGAKSAFMPRVEGEAGYGWQDDEFVPEDQQWLAGVSVRIPIFNGFADTHGLAAKKAEWRRQKALREKLIQDVKREVWNSHLRVLEAFRSVQASESLVRSADESLRAERQRYGSGAGTLSDLLDSEHMVLRAQAALVTSRLDYHMAEADYGKSIGSLAEK
ncbi:Outer membrane protein TolC [Desulfatibacillum alkenivorans DSM 16219]|jgi:outer membrane protein TolC|uniref:Outer membrane protein TolC n=1 Tax=Desulfatibacillum alkenivorans DSM 16219 TaxID=1121393 RepID=A0A1M7A0W3_9BACT|nr:TolC family protein [Desulfatibacillum alkenivorans]SHL36357.1 Outer membrane protein TolC [Desulfatibacillum alkenivorans DSM 16219]